MTYDVVVAGAGTAGLALAWQLARRGQRVLVLERGALEAAGATWINGVSAAQFDAAGLARPVAPEDRGGGAMHLIAGWGLASVRVTSDVREVDMALLTARLRGMAGDAGVTLRSGVAALGEEPGGLRTTDGLVRAEVYVDASGLGGLPWRAGARPAREALCAAVQQVRRVGDVAAARAFFAGHGVPEGEAACFTSVAGGYSIVNARLHGDTLSLLTGSIPALGAPSGKALAAQFAAAQPWVGAPLREGARAIPLGPPPRAIDDGRWLRIGDAAGMVYATHGSGIGPQLVASAVIAEALVQGGGPRAASRAWARSCRPALAEAAAFQRFSLGVTVEQLARWMRAGLLHPELVAAGLEQRAPRVGPPLLAALLRAVARDPGAAPKLAPALLGMARAKAGAQLRAWA